LEKARGKGALALASKKINPDEWHLFRRRPAKVHPFALDLMYRYSTLPVFRSTYGSEPFEIANVLEGDWPNACVEKRKLEHLGKKLVAKVRKNPGFTKMLVSKSMGLCRRLDRLLGRLESQNLAAVSNAGILRIYKELADPYAWLCFYALLMGMFGEGFLHEELKGVMAGKGIGEQEANGYVNLLASPNVPSIVHREELTKLELALALRRGKRKSALAGLPMLAKKFGPFIYDYSGPDIKTEKQYLAEITACSRKNDLERQVSEKRSYYKKLKSRQKKLAGRLSLSASEMALASALQDIAFLQDVRKYYNSYFNFHTEKLFREIGRRLGISHRLARYLLPREMEAALRSGRADAKILGQRTRLCVFHRKGALSEIFIGREMKPYLCLKNDRASQLDAIKGTIASLGVTKGKARIITDRKNISKVKKGEIIVTPMTSPDFTFAIRRCSAIVTDEGGITSHAAVISREFGLPCVIGTKIATRAIHDGDTIEVDANKGVVRILKRA
jgi:phosphohistidine swiveling domain-containing protein